MLCGDLAGKALVPIIDFGKGYSKSGYFGQEVKLKTEEEIVEYQASGSPLTDILAANAVYNSGIEDMIEVSRQANPLGIVPLIALTNRPRVSTPQITGRST